MEATFRINEDGKRFELETADGMAFIDYILRSEGVIFLTHTEVPKAMNGKGHGSSLVRQSLDYIEAQGWKLVPLCPFVAAWLVRHPERQHLIMKGYHVK